MIFPAHEEWSRAHHLRLMRKFRSSSKITDFDLAYDGCRSNGTLLLLGWCWWGGGSCSFGWYSAKDTLLFKGSMSMLVSLGLKWFIVVLTKGEIRDYFGEKMWELWVARFFFAECCEGQDQDNDCVCYLFFNNSI